MTSVNPGSSDPGEHRRPGKVAVVLNPASGGDTAAERSHKLRAKLEEAGVDLRWYETTPEDPGRGMARQALDDGAELVLACGGDGTVMACATALAGTDVPLAVVPFGTGNLVAANFDIPTDMDDAIEIALECRRRRIDLGAHGDDRFVVAAGMGFDAEMLRDADKRLKARLGPLAYVISGLKHIRRPQTGFQLRLDDAEPIRRRGQDVMVANLGRIQGGLPILPDALPDDGEFDIAVFRTRSLRDWAVVAWSVIVRSHRRPPEMETFRARRVQVRVGRPQPLQFDGDPVDPVSELELAVDPVALTLAVPAHQVDQTSPVRRHPA
jgi:YegS/Rv2252/BmrU family lipid kinase